VPDVHRVAQVERRDELGEIVGVGVHLVAAPGLTRAAMPAAIVRDAAVAARRQEQHLVVPRIGRERPAVTEDDRLAGAPVLEVDLRAVLDCDSRARHLRANGRCRHY
jgi:hypothetical protein